MIFDGLKDEQIAEMAREDFSAARDSRREVEERKLDLYRLYRLFRKELVEGGKGSKTNGPFGWSRLSSPMVFWIVETILPRVGINTPTVVVKARAPSALPYVQAKQLRVNHQMRMAHMEEEVLLALKQFLILGDGPCKTPWDADLGGPSLKAIDWFDWFVSPDAARWHQAEVMFHRTWHTKRSLQALAERDASRRDPRTGERMPPQYDLEALERVASGSAYQDADDPTWTDRRDAAGIGPARFPEEDGPIALVECHYRDGSMAVIAGDDSPIMVRVVREPRFLDPRGRVFRPFVVFQNTPDLFQPYGISDAEMVADHQHESSTIKNQAIDQATGNINAPKGYDKRKVRPEEITAAWGQPNGLFGTDGPPRDAIEQFQPGQLSGDVERMLEHNRREAQEVVGISDVVQGLAASQAQTATEIASLREEANMRFRLKIKLVEFAMRRVAQHFDWLDRRVSMESLSVEIEQGFALEPQSRGVTMLGDGGFARVDTAANAPANEYELELDAGSMMPPNRSEETEQLRALIGDLGAIPLAAGMVNWPEVIRMLVEAHGHDPDRVLMQMPAMPAGPGQITPGPPEPGEEPVGEPIPVDQNGAGGVPVGA